MKKLMIFPLLWLLCGATLNGQPFSFSMPNSNFVLIPGGGFESRAWVEVPPGDSVILSATAGPELYTLFQPSVVRQNQFVYLVVISTDSLLSPFQTAQLCARHHNDSITKTIHITNANDGHGFYHIDSARYLKDTAFGYLKHTFPLQKIFLGSLQQSPWVPCFPYPSLLIVTHHLFVYENWRIQTLWHNMVPPDDWSKVYIYNEEIDSCYGVHIDTWGTFSFIPCDIWHYNHQDTIMGIPASSRMPDVTISPNPTRDAITVSMSGPCRKLNRIDLRNQAGQVLRQFAMVENGDEPLVHLGDLPAGLYLLTLVFDNGEALHRKVIKL